MDGVKNLKEFGTVAAYSLYVLGGGVAVGVVRVAMSVAYLAKHLFYQTTYQAYAKNQSQKNFNDLQSSALTRAKENREAAKQTAQAKGFVKKAGAWLSERKTNTQNAVGGVIDELAYEAKETVNEMTGIGVDSIQKTRRAPWENQALRGVIELIPIFGAAYYTYRDWQDSKKIMEIKPGVMGLNSLAQTYQNEKRFDQGIKTTMKGYNPII